MKNYLKLLVFLKGHYRLFFWAVLFMLLSSIFEGFQLPVLVPLIDRVFTDKQIIVANNLPSFVNGFIAWVNGMDKLKLLHVILTGAVFVVILKQVFTFIHEYLMNDVAQRVMRDIRFKIYEKIQKLSLEYFSQKRTGELISRITYDVQSIENAVSYALTDVVKQSFLVIFYTIVVFSIHPKAAMMIFIFIPLLAFPLSKIGKRLKKLASHIQEKMADITSLLLETISGVKVVKAFSTESYELKRFHERNHELYKLSMKTVKRLQAITPVSEVIGVVCLVPLMLWFSRQTMNGEISLGVFMLFIGSFMLLMRPLKKLGNVNAIVQKALAANKRIYQILDEPITVEEKTGAVDIGPLSREIRFEHVSFGYDPSLPKVLKDLNITIKAGELVAVVGPTGVGKTTLVNLIPRFYDATEGRITIDGMDVKDATFKSLRSQIGIVTQETILFNDTVRSNIVYGNFDCKQDLVKKAAQQAYANHFIERLPSGYDTVIGDRGFRLSGGEKQRLTIARAILKNPPVLILDEATSQLDSESEKYIQEALDQLMEGRTVVAIAHRLSTIKKADKIIVLNEGHIEAQGKHDELMQRSPLYRRLHDTQFQT